MERSEPTLVPEWLKNAGSQNGGSTVSHSDNQTSSKLARNRSFVNSNDHDSGRSFSSDKTTSSYFRRSSSSNGSGRLRSHSSFGRQHDRDWQKDTYGSLDRDKLVLGDRRYQDFSDASRNTSFSKSERGGFRRSHLLASGKHEETWHKKTITDSSTGSGANANGLLTKGSPIGGVKKTFFERDFPSLGPEDRAVTPAVGRVSSPGLSSAIQGLPLGSSTIGSGEKWTSALAEVPVLVGSSGTDISPVQQAAPSNSTSVVLGTTTSLNMAEAIAQASNRGQTTPMLHVGTQRLEELAIKQSRQLIPVTPSTPKTLVLNSSDKQKNRVGGPVKGDVSKASNLGKLHVLMPVREKNGAIPLVKDNVSPTSGSKLVSCTLAAPSVSGSAATRGPINNSVPDPKPVLTVLEKRPTSQARSRNEFFNSVRKKSMENSSAIADSPTTVSSSVLDTSTAAFSLKHAAEMEVVSVPNASQEVNACLGVSLGVGDLTSNGDGCEAQKHVNNGKRHPISDPCIICSEEEEAAFLRSLGWEENADEGGLTEEEISAFFKEGR